MENGGFEERRDSQNGVIWRQRVLKNIRKHWWNKVFALLEMSCKIPYKTNSLWRLLEAFLRRSSANRPKSITFIDKTQWHFTMSKTVIKPMENGVFEEPRDSQNGVIWTHHVLKNIKKALVKTRFSRSTKSYAKYLIKTNSLWRLLEAFEQKGSKSIKKALRL